MSKGCTWCVAVRPDADPDPDALCVDHAAEYYGLTVGEMEREREETGAEWADTGIGWRY